MKKLVPFAVVVSLAMAACQVLVTVAQEKTVTKEKTGEVTVNKAAGPGVKKWEYKAAYFPGEEKLNEFGEQGWELVAVTNTGHHSSGFAYFKRAKQ